MNRIFLTVAVSPIELVQTGLAKDCTLVQQTPLLTAYFCLKATLVAGPYYGSAMLACSRVKEIL